jgi:circadian clock protein KaiC
MASGRLSTGIKNLDKLISGGFKKRSVNLIAGMPGSGKSIFAAQFIMAGLQAGDAGIFITFEQKRDKFFEDMKSMGWDFEPYEKRKKFTFLEYIPEQVKKMLTEGGGVVENIIEKTKAKRLVIDSISSFSLLYEDQLTRREASLALFELIEAWDCTSILTSQAQEKSDHVIEAALEFESDSIIFLYHFLRKGHRIRALEIFKMRATKIPEKIYSFDIDKGGIKLDPKKIVDM